MGRDSSRVPGVIIAHSPTGSERFIGSPSIARLPEGNYIASHDYFGPGGDRGRFNESAVFGSTDEGLSWEHLASLKGQFWRGLVSS